MAGGQVGGVETMRMQIGEVADQVGLSLRTIRFYEEAGLVIPSARSAGGFRLYSKTDLNRLQLIKRMKPLGFSVEEIGEFLGMLDSLASEKLTGVEREAVVSGLEDLQRNVDDRIVALVAKVEQAREFALQLAEMCSAPRTQLDRA